MRRPLMRLGKVVFDKEKRLKAPCLRSFQPFLYFIIIRYMPFGVGFKHLSLSCSLGAGYPVYAPEIGIMLIIVVIYWRKSEIYMRIV